MIVKMKTQGMFPSMKLNSLQINIICCFKKLVHYHKNVEESIIQFTKEIMEIIPPPKIVKNELISLINTKTISHRTAKKNSYS